MGLWPVVILTRHLWLRVKQFMVFLGGETKCRLLKGGSKKNPITPNVKGNPPTHQLERKFANATNMNIDILNSKLRRPTFCCSCYLTPCEQLSIWTIPPNSSFPRRFSARGGLGWEAAKRLESSDMGLNSSSLQTTQAVN